MSKKLAVLAMATLLLGACSTVPNRKAAPPPITTAPIENKTVVVPSGTAPSGSAPSGGGYLAGDGPGENTPGNLDAVPDAVPKKEPLHRYANRPYIALGKTYKPLTVAGNFKERGIASWYGKKFNGARTSSGETYDMYAMTAAHPTLPLPSYARVTNLANQKSVIVRINDRGPFLNDRIIDLSYTAAYKLDIINDGSAAVEVESLSPNAIVSTIVPSTVHSQALESSSPVGAGVTPADTATVVNALPVVTNPGISASRVDTLPAAALAPIESSNTAVYLQLGAFSSQAGAAAYRDRMRSKLGGTGKELKLTAKDGLVRVHIGPYANQSEARSSAESMEEILGFKPMVNLP
jgi:rare lipoprotein A